MNKQDLIKLAYSDNDTTTKLIARRAVFGPVKFSPFLKKAEEPINWWKGLPGSQHFDPRGLANDVIQGQAMQQAQKYWQDNPTLQGGAYGALGGGLLGLGSEMLGSSRKKRPLSSLLTGAMLGGGAGAAGTYFYNNMNAGNTPSSQPGINAGGPGVVPAHPGLIPVKDSAGRVTTRPMLQDPAHQVKADTIEPNFWSTVSGPSAETAKKHTANQTQQVSLANARNSWLEGLKQYTLEDKYKDEAWRTSLTDPAKFPYTMKEGPQIEALRKEYAGAIRPEFKDQPGIIEDLIRRSQVAQAEVEKLQRTPASKTNNIPGAAEGPDPTSGTVPLPDQGTNEHENLAQNHENQTAGGNLAKATTIGVVGGMAVPRFGVDTTAQINPAKGSLGTPAQRFTPEEIAQGRKFYNVDPTFQFDQASGNFVHPTSGVKFHQTPKGSAPLQNPVELTTPPGRAFGIPAQRFTDAEELAGRSKFNVPANHTFNDTKGQWFSPGESKPFQTPGRSYNPFNRAGLKRRIAGGAALGLGSELLLNHTSPWHGQGWASGLPHRTFDATLGRLGGAAGQFMPSPVIPQMPAPVEGIK